MNQQSKNALSNAKHREWVVKTLTEHSVKLENIQKYLDISTTDFKLVIQQISQLEQRFMYFKGLSYFLMAGLVVFISLIGLLS
mgnify:CR=1 FL=1|tara:strand:+ start:381 stop:629 length:249 start_codon:yes stop_codon:yes gene_type:complete